MERATFPLLATVRTVNLLDFIQRLDAIVVLTLMITVFFKAAIYLYCTVIGIVDLFKLKTHQHILLPVGCILIFFSMIIATDFSEMAEEGFITVHYYLGIPLLILVPLCMLVVTIIRNRFKQVKDDTGKSEPNVT
jgi:spore germination protein KB